MAASSNLLVEEQIHFRAVETSSGAVSGKIAHVEFEFSAGDRSPETVGFRTSSSVANSYPSEAKTALPVPRLSRERFNAALAAGLIDPSRIELAESTVPKLNLARERATSQTWMPVMIPMTAQAKELQAPFVKFADATPGRLTAPRRPAAPRQTNKHFSLGFISKAGTSRKADDHDAQSRDLTENLQRFASDFVRANQNDNFAEQHRFFADSVHFYGEGDLSLASVEAATRRYRREQQPKRSEVAEPASATGPVNGGFFVIEQPVRWTQSQGTRVEQGRSVLRLRVVPINHGGWKITSIDEVGK